MVSLRHGRQRDVQAQKAIGADRRTDAGGDFSHRCAHSLFGRGIRGYGKGLARAVLVLTLSLAINTLFFPVPVLADTCASNSNGTGDNAPFGSSGSGTTLGWATLFTATETCTVTSMAAEYYVSNGSPTGVRLQIFTDVSNAPGTVVGTCNGTPSPTPSATKQMYTQASCGGFTITSGVSYFFALNVSADNPTGNFYRQWAHNPPSFACYEQNTVDGAWSNGPNCGQDDIQFTVTGTPPAAAATASVWQQLIFW